LDLSASAALLELDLETPREPLRNPVPVPKTCPHNIVETAREAGTFQTLLTAVEAAGLGELDKRKIEIPTPIKAVGEHEATVRLRDEVSATITLQVVAAK
jgi:hypothetical protein